jgi:hypothetical protein
VQPLYFRPPYDIDEEPDTDDQAAPVGAFSRKATPSSATRSTPTTGTSIQRKTPAGDCANGAGAVQTMKTKPQFRGSIILLHDGGGDRSGHRGCAAGADRRAARPRLHHRSGLALMGKTTAQVMPPLTFLAAPARHCPIPLPSPVWTLSATSS